MAAVVDSPTPVSATDTTELGSLARFSLADISQVSALYQCSRAAEACFAGEFIRSEYWLREVLGEDIWLIKNEVHILGFVSIWPPQRFIHHLYVHPEYQRRGIGRRLLKQCAEHYGYPLNLKCLVANTQACQFYQRRGWIKLGKAAGLNGAYYDFQLQANSVRKASADLNM